MVDLPNYIVLLYEYLENLLKSMGINRFNPDNDLFSLSIFNKIIFILIGAIINLLNIKILGKLQSSLQFYLYTIFIWICLYIYSF